ncbi:uncharacterized protein [Ptychodera flava]|uniref:uncharacterized protein n=1 Tax=Ptychodera flava TaxID=63121 RepID=UPI003969C800
MDELQTIVNEIEAVLNDCPLKYVSSDLTDPQPLTPAHLLHGRMLTPLPQSTIDTDKMTDPDFAPITPSEVNKRAEYLASLHQTFWRRWSSEYITALRERHHNKKHNTTANRIKIGDVVLVHNDNQKRLYWNLAVVEQPHIGNDGLVRSADIRINPAKLAVQSTSSTRSNCQPRKVNKNITTTPLKKL